MLSVIMPSYKEASTIRQNLIRTEKKLKLLKKPYEIILVDDGSKEKVYLNAKGISKHIRVLRYHQNWGKGNALKFGFMHSKGDSVMFFDSDLDIPPEQIKVLLDYMEKTNADIVIGSKRHPKSKIKYPMKRRILSIGYQVINKFLFGLNVKDTQVGIKLFRGKVLEEVLPKIVVKKYAFDLELLVAANKHSYKIVEAPVHIKYNMNFSSGVSPKQILHIFVDTLAIAYRLYIVRQYD